MSLEAAIAGADGAAAPRRLSAVLRDLAQGTAGRLSFGDLVAGLKDRGFAPLLVLFALPNIVLFVPGSSAVTGVALMLLSLQLVTGRTTVWLPAVLRERSIERATFSRLVTASLPGIERVERMARPRLWPQSTALADRLIGLVSLVMATLLFLPLPLANALPGLAIVLLAIGLGERDGVWLAVGLAAAGVASAVVLAVVSTGAFALWKVFS